MRTVDMREATTTLARLVDPVLVPFRRVVPVIGGIDLSSMVLLLALQIGVMLLS